MPAAKVSPAKPPAKSAKTRQSPPTLVGTVAAQPDAAREAALAAYQSAVTAMQKGDYAAAHPAFEKLLRTSPPEFVERIRMYLAACIAQSNKKSVAFSSQEEKYDYAISLLNDGQYEDAREHLDEILAGDSNADYAFYGLAVLASVTGDTQSCLEKLSESIRLNGANRIHARSDSDFQDMRDDPRFTELLYPEA